MYGIHLSVIFCVASFSAANCQIVLTPRLGTERELTPDIENIIAPVGVIAININGKFERELPIDVGRSYELNFNPKNPLEGASGEEEDDGTGPALVIAYEHANFRGKYELVHLTRSCYNLKTLVNQTSSINTHNSCVKAYNEEKCSGDSMWITPNYNDSELRRNNDMIASIRLC